MKKRGKLFPFFFMMFWGVAVVVFVTVLFGTSSLGDGVDGIIMIFPILVGVAVFSLGLANVIKTLRKDNLAKNAKRGKGYFISAKEVSKAGGNRYYGIRFSYTNDQGVDTATESSQVFTAEEVSLYRGSGSFDIIYTNGFAEIDTDGNIYPKEHAEKTICPYCGSRFEGDKCHSCGAKASHRQ